MPIIGFNLDKILVERKKNIGGSIKVKNDVNIKSINEQEVSIGSKKEKVLKFNFEFSSEYQPDIANISINGHILFIDDTNRQKKILESWKKDKNILPEVVELIINTALIRCNIKALSLSQDLNLPPNIRLPSIRRKVDV